jgi:tRNA 2-thiouridine synthesizing protein A
MAGPVTIDVRGLKCPLPVLKAERRMRGFAAGTHFVLLTTDPMAAIDLPHFCTENGHRLLASHRDGNLLRFEIEKK